MGKYKAKKKQYRTIFVKDDTQIADIMKVISVCGEIGYSSIKLFGLSGEKTQEVKYRKTREQMLEHCEFKSGKGEVLFKGEAFTRRGKGQEKTVRVTSGGHSLFGEFEWGKEYLKKYTHGSLPTDRERVLRSVALSEWCIFMLRSGIEFNPTVNPELYNFSHKTSGPQAKSDWTPHKIDRPIFYPSKEIKRKQGNSKIRGRGSRAYGFLVNKDKVEVCYRLPKTRMVWQEKEEGIMGTYATATFGPQNFGIKYSPQRPDALCLVDGYDKCEQVIFAQPYATKKARKENPDLSVEKTLFKDLFLNVFVFPRDEGGIKSFIFHNIPNINDLIFDFYVAEESYRENTYRSGYDCDAFDYDENVATLFFFDGNITKLHSCATTRRLHNYEGRESPVKLRIFCFPWQTEYIKNVFAGTTGVDIIEQDYDRVIEFVTKK